MTDHSGTKGLLYRSKDTVVPLPTTEEICIEQHFEDGAGKERKTLAVIIEAIEAAALEVVLVVDEVEGNAVPLRLE